MHKCKCMHQMLPIGEGLHFISFPLLKLSPCSVGMCEMAENVATDRWKHRLTDPSTMTLTTHACLGLTLSSMLVKNNDLTLSSMLVKKNDCKNIICSDYY